MDKIKVVFVIFICLIAFNSFSQEVTEKNYNTFQEFLDEQNLKISKIDIGLSKEESQQLMGNAIVVNVPKVGKMKPLNKLFKQPEFTNEYSGYSGEKIYVCWYFTTPKDQNGVISKSECTPVIFENDKVVGIGLPFFKSYRSKIKLN